MIEPAQMELAIEIHNRSLSPKLDIPPMLITIVFIEGGCSFDASACVCAAQDGPHMPTGPSE